MRQNVVLAAALIAVILIMLVAPATAQQPPSPTPPTPTNEAIATPTKICPTFEPTIQATPETNWYRYQGEDSVGRPDKDSNAYCGQTCVAMAIQYVRGQDIPISEIVIYVEKGRYQFTNHEDLKVALDKWGVDYIPITAMRTVCQAVK